MNRKFAVTTWDSMTGEAHSCVVEVPNNENPFELAAAIHEAVCKDSGEDPEDWQATGCWFASDGDFPVAGVSIWLASDGTISSENFRELVTDESTQQH